MDEIIQGLAQIRFVGKSDGLSWKFKEQGNEAYMKGDFDRALILYNKAISCAICKQCLAVAYANRSAVFLDLGLFDECLLNIKWALETGGYPEDKIQKLNDREEKAKKLKAAQVKYPVEDPWNFFKLSHPANPKIPFIVDCLEMKKTEKFGRGIYATRDISTGDILSIEDPVIQHPGNSKEQSFYNRCFNCIKTCRMNLIPCLKSNGVMFCSEDCRDKAYKKMSGEELFEGPQRKIYADIEEKFGGRGKLLEFLKTVPDITKLDYSVFDFDWNDPNDPEYGINQMKCVLSLIGMECYRLASLPNIKRFEPADRVTKGSKHIEELLNHIASIMLLRMLFQKEDEPTAVVMFANLINYSCISNVQYILVDNKTILYATQPIKAGEQLFENYRFRETVDGHEFEMIVHYLIMKTEERQGLLEATFNYTCDCLACKEDLQYKQRQMVDKDFCELMTASKACVVKTNSDTLKPAVDQWKLNNDYITKHHENILGMDVYMIKKLNLQLIEKIAGAAELKF